MKISMLLPFFFLFFTLKQPNFLLCCWHNSNGEGLQLFRALFVAEQKAKTVLWYLFASRGRCTDLALLSHGIRQRRATIPRTNVYQDQFTGEEMADRQMEWLVRRGDRLQETPPKNTPFDVFYYSSEFQDCRVSAILYRFNGNHASERVEEEGKFDIALLCQLLIKPWAV